MQFQSQDEDDGTRRAGLEPLLESVGKSRVLWWRMEWRWENCKQMRVLGKLGGTGLVPYYIEGTMNENKMQAVCRVQQVPTTVTQSSKNRLCVGTCCYRASWLILNSTDVQLQ